MNKTKIIGLTILLTMFLGTISFASSSNDLKIIEKQVTVDYKNADDTYKTINKTLVEDKGYYELESIDRVDNLKTLTKEHEIVEEKITNTNDLENVIKLFNETKDIESDGYVGTLTRDNSSLKIEIKDSYQEEYKVYLQKSYNNVPSNELNDIPKEIKTNGTTYYLINPVWEIVETESISNSEVPVKYNGTMYYEGVKTKTIVTSYLATIKYTGTISKQVPDTTTFTIQYKEVKEYGYIIPTVIGTTGIIFFSGIIVFKLKNARIYNLQNGEYKLIKKLHINKNKLFINLTPTNFQTKKYKIVLSKSLYKAIANKNMRIKYFDKEYIYKIEKREFEIIL